MHNRTNQTIEYKSNLGETLRNTEESYNIGMVVVWYWYWVSRHSKKIQGLVLQNRALSNGVYPQYIRGHLK